MRTCQHCGVNIAGKRANARYCSTSCRVMGNRAKTSTGIPPEMTRLNRWVSWRPVKRGQRWTKLPIQVNGRNASSTNPDTWTAFENVAGLERRGFVLGDGIGCIDLDHCIEDGVVASWARQIVDEYRERALLVEVSPSGTGVHIFLPMATGQGRVIRDGRSIEIYPPDSGRYICVTGKVLM